MAASSDISDRILPKKVLIMVQYSKLRWHKLALKRGRLRDKVLHVHVLRNSRGVGCLQLRISLAKKLKIALHFSLISNSLSGREASTK